MSQSFIRSARRSSFVVGAIAVGALAAPSLASAANSPVTATIGSELSVGVATPAAMVVTHAAPGTATSLVTVVSTATSWTLSVSDNNTAANSGHLIKVAGTAPLDNALQWSNDAGVTPHAMTGTAATVGTGSGVGTKTVTYSQSLGASEAVSGGDTYAATIVYAIA